MISRDKLVALLSNTKFKKINLPNNIQYTQLSFFDTKKKNTMKLYLILKF